MKIVVKYIFGNDFKELKNSNDTKQTHIMKMELRTPYTILVHM